MSLSAFQNPLDGTSSRDPRELIQDAANLLARSPSGVLWISRSVALTGPLDIPAHVTLAFAPGARFELAPDAVVTIAGPLDAGLEPRFVLGPGARVHLVGPLDEIHADWWVDDGTGGGPVLRALEALWDRYARFLDPAPIQLGGPYALFDPIRVAPTPTLREFFATAFFDVVLRGRHYGPNDPTTFRVTDSVQIGSIPTLLAIDGNVVLTLEHVGFDLTRPPGRVPPLEALSLAGEHDRSRIEACYFKLAGATGIHITTYGQEWRDVLVASLGIYAGLVDVVGARGAARRATRVDIARCVFEGESASAVAIDVDATAPTNLRVTDSQFHGFFDRCIAFAGAELTVTACSFANETSMSFLDEVHGADIHLGTRAPLPLPIVAVAAANARLTATHCVSTSPMFLKAAAVFSAAGAAEGGAVLTNIYHRPAAPGAIWSVHCGLGYGPRSLMLQGCEFGASVGATMPGVGVVVDLGTTFDLVTGVSRRFVTLRVDSVVTLTTPRPSGP